MRRASGQQGDGVSEARLVTVRATNYDGSDHWVHPATLLHADNSLLITQTHAGLDIRRERGSFTSPYNTRAHYWPDHWFNVIRLELPGQGLWGYYCNIATPLQFDGQTVSYIDLQLDVLARVDEAGELSFWVADEDEFQAARKLYAYPDDLVERCYRAVDEVIAMIEARQFPFDG
jgi:protein associated with RNAse G/E